MSKAMVVVRFASALFGLALVVALWVGSTALAAVPGDPLRLGRLNAINALTRISGTANKALLRIENGGKGNYATALELQTDPQQPPMRANSLTKVENLHADLLDGKLDGKGSTAFFSGKTCTVKDGRLGAGGSKIAGRILSCDEGDKVWAGHSNLGRNRRRVGRQLTRGEGHSEPGRKLERVHEAQQGHQLHRRKGSMRLLPAA